MVAFSKHRLMATFFNYENPELFGVQHYMPDYSICSIVDNVILLNFIDTGNALRRAITVAKARGSDHILPLVRSRSGMAVSICCR